MIEMFTRKSVKSRKIGPCAWCAEAIESGERIVVDSGKFDGDFFRSRLHLECAKALDSMHPRDMEKGYVFGEYKRGSTEPS